MGDQIEAGCCIEPVSPLSPLGRTIIPSFDSVPKTRFRVLSSHNL